MAHSHFRERAADDPRNQLLGPEFSFDQRRSGPFQRAQGRTFGGEPIRSDEGKKSRGRDQGIAVGTWTAVCCGAHGSQAHSSGCGRNHLRGEGGAQGQGGEDHVRRQPARQQPDSARGDEEPEAHRRPALHFPGEYFLQDL